jgi:hypothetical protein
VAAVWFVARTEFRHRWRSWVVLAVLVAVAGGVVLAATAAGRRTADAFPSFVRSYGFDSVVYAPQPIPAITKLPEVSSATVITSPANGAPTCSCGHAITSNTFSVFELEPGAFAHFAKLLSGRMPAPSRVNETLASISLEKDYGVHIGDTLRIPFFTAAQAAQSNLSPTAEPAGPTVAMKVVGIAVNEADFPSVGTPAYEVFATPAFDRAINPKTGVFTSYAVRLRRGHADLVRFDRDTSALGAYGTGAQETTTSVTAAIHPQAMGWWLLALLAGVVGAVMIAQALSRQATVEDDTYRTLGAVGLSPPRLVALGMVRAVFVGVVGALGAMAIAYALSPVAPVGEARYAEPSTGYLFDALVLVGGAAAVVLAVALLGVWPAIRGSRTRRRRVAEQGRRASTVVARLSAVGAPPTTIVGVRRALERGYGRNAVPVGTAFTGTVLAVAALCCTTVFGASLSHLTSTPRLYGQPFRFWLNSFGGSGPAQADQLVAGLRTQPDVTAITLGTSGSVTVNGIATDAIAGRPVRGGLLVSAVNGRVPLADNEVALGVNTMRQAGAHVGSTVHVTFPLANGRVAHSDYRVVGTASFPPDFGVVALTSGAVFTLTGFVDAQCPPGTGGASCRTTTANAASYVVLVGTKSGAVGQRIEDAYLKIYPNDAVAPITPENLVNFGQAVNFPLILGLILLLFGAATLVHVLVVSVARRRRELALLKALGFVRYQAAATVCWQSTTVALVGVIVGVPLGLAAGHVAWVSFATNLGVVPDPVVPVLTVSLLAVGVLVAANLLAVGPGLLSARELSSRALRSD